MSIFKNREVKLIIIGSFITFFIFLGVVVFISYSWFNDINLKYVQQNSALLGAIVSENPELEEVIIPIITKGEIQGNYDIGVSILDKYSYNGDMEVIKNPLLTKSYSVYKGSLMYVWIIFFIILNGIVIVFISPIFKKIKALGIKADEMVEGNFKSSDIHFEEGEFYVFYNKFMHMGERLENALNDLYQEKVNLKDIINDISHQLKTPLAALITYNDILHNHEVMDTEAKSKFINLSSEQMDRMDWLITTLLKYARIESNAVNYNKENKSLRETILYAIEPLKVTAKEKSQTITFDSDSKGYYNHDKKWIGESLSNIIKNAIEHTDVNGKINIKLEEMPLSVIISIRDNGEGIENTEIKNIFKRFYKGKNSINPKSIGIGLSLSKKIIEYHGGSINVESEVGKGTIFNIIFLKVVV